MPSRTRKQGGATPADVEVPTRSDIVTSILLPAYNEVENVGPLIEEIEDVFGLGETDSYRPFEVIVVDDGSTDGTDRRLAELALEKPFLRAVVLTRNFGQSAALAAGVASARGEVIVTMDADGQNNPADIPALLETLEEGYDCVSGWRKDRKDPISKRLPSRLQTWMARLTGPDIHDFGCTLKAYRASALNDIDIYGEAHRYIPAMLYKRGYDITEIVVDHRPRTRGTTKYGTMRLLKGFVDLLFHVFWNRYSARPIHFLGGVGFLLIAVGLVVGSHAVIIKYAFGVSLLPRTPRLILTVALVMFGVQLLMFGFLAEMISKIHYGQSYSYRIATTFGFEDEE